MASAVKIREVLPATLPEDFGGWDSEASPSTQPVRLAGSDHGHSLGVVPFRTGTAEPKPASRKLLIIAGASAALAATLAAAMIPVWSHKTAPAVKPVTVLKPAVTKTQQPEVATFEPAPSMPAVSAPAPAAAARDAQHSSVAAPPSDRENASPSQAQAQMMNEQLNAPARIRIAAASAEQAPPPSAGFAAADMEGLGNNNAIGSVFSSAKQPRVLAAPPKVVTVSAGVAFGLLIQKRPPVYPPSAKTAGISGTVVLAATISRTGTIENLHVVSGPVMLRGSAVDAVRSWRYKPYKLNNQPTEIETTINVSFSLDN